jgi:hypothetical protein
MLDEIQASLNFLKHLDQSFSYTNESFRQATYSYKKETYSRLGGASASGVKHGLRFDQYEEIGDLRR